MRFWLVFGATVIVPVSAFAQAAKPCEQLKAEIAKKLEANGVKTYSLEIVEKDKRADGAVVGSCDGGKRKLVYRRTATAAQPRPPAAGKP